MKNKAVKTIQTDYPPDIIDDFISWLTEHGYNYEEIFKSSLKTQQYYLKRFFKEAPGNKTQLKFPF